MQFCFFASKQVLWYSNGAMQFLSIVFAPFPNKKEFAKNRYYLEQRLVLCMLLLNFVSLRDLVLQKEIESAVS